MYTVSFHTFGCKLNQAETAMMIQDFEDQGYYVVSWDQDVDVSVLNTCTVTGRSDAKCRKAVRHLQKLNPNTTIIVAGCYSQMDAEEVSSLSGVDYVLGTQEKLRIFDYFQGPGKLFEPRIYVSSVNAKKEVVSHDVGHYFNHTRAFLRIQNGCNRGCAYCIVPLVRGPSWSVPVREVVCQAEALIRRGYKEIVITGVHVGNYGKEWGNCSLLPSLLRSLVKIDGSARIRLSSLNPEDITDELLECIADSEIICRHFHIPLQSGSDVILSTMRRHYTTKEYRKKIEKIVGIFENVGLGTDVIVGFPGETDTLFKETFSVIEELPFTYLHVFPFSPRKGTVAAVMPHQVVHNVRMERAKMLRVLGQRKRETFAKKWLNKEVVVLLENKNQEGWMGGFSSEYFRVEVPYRKLLGNKLVLVRVEDIRFSGARGKVIGKVIDE